MNPTTTIMEEQEYKKIDDGLYQAVNPIAVDIDDWSYDNKHIGYQAITEETDDQTFVRILYVSTTGSASMKLISLFNSLRKQGKMVGYIEGVPEANAMGEIYV